MWLFCLRDLSIIILKLIFPSKYSFCIGNDIKYSGENCDIVI